MCIKEHLGNSSRWVSTAAAIQASMEFRIKLTPAAMKDWGFLSICCRCRDKDKRYLKRAMCNWNPELMKIFSLQQSTSIWISVGNESFCLTDYRKTTVKKKGFFFPFARQQNRFLPHQKLQFLRNNIKQIREPQQKKPPRIINQQWWAEE